MADIETLKEEYSLRLVQLSNPELISNPEKFEDLLKKKNILEKIISKEKNIQEIKVRIEENKQIIASREDPELSALAEAELGQLTETLPFLNRDLVQVLEETEKKIKNNESAIIEIRA